MTNITFFFLLIPFLALALLIVNFIFASHTPYQEKNSTFECGFHSFLGQNRMQFNISFYIFGLLFLLFDLEILLIYPYPVSAQFNLLYGLIVMLIFFLILTLGFTFELGKNALKIDSRQYDNKSIIYKLNNNNNKLLNSGLFNKPINFSFKIKDILLSLLSGIIVLIFFTYALKYFVFNLDCVLMCILCGIISVIGLTLKTIMKSCFMNDIKRIDSIMSNKKKFLLEILIRFLIAIIITYVIIFILACFDVSGDFYEIFFGVAMCDDFIYQEWIDIVYRIDFMLTNPRSRLRLSLHIAEQFDHSYSVTKDEHIAAWRRPNFRTPEGKDYIAGCKLSEDIMKGMLDDQWTDFVKQRGDLRRSATRIREKFEELPDNHDGKKYFLNKINNQMTEIQSLGGNLKNKRIRPTPGI